TEDKKQLENNNKQYLHPCHLIFFIVTSLPLISRNLKVKYRRSIFGFLWTLLHPLLLGSIFFFLFKYIAKIQIPDYGAFVVVSIMPWTFFSQSVIEASESMYNNAHLLRKIYFPREAFPMSSVVTNFITLILSLPVMVVFAYTAGGGIGWQTLALIPILALTLMVTYGVGLLLSVLYIFYRDVRHIIGILIQVLFYGTPVIYEAKMVPEVWKPVLLLNPMASLIPAYRDVILYQRWPDWTAMGASALVTFGIVAVAYNYFAKYNRVIPEYV
ncbi:MAG: ABC transporter permease, partial [Bdellovibrionia bacterium]